MSYQPIKMYVTLILGLVIPYILFLIRIPTWAFQIVSIIWIIFILKQIITYIYTQIPQYIPIILIAITLVVVGFSFYFRMDRDYAAYVSNAYYLIQKQGFFSEAFYMERGLHIINGLYVPSFLLGYSVYLAMFVSIFGDIGLIIANIILLMISLIFIDKVYHIIAKETYSPRLFAVIFLLNPVVLWIYSYTYSETLFIAMVWGAISIFLLGLNQKNIVLVFLSFIGIIFSITTRVEGLGLIVTFGLSLIFALYLIKKDWKQKIVLMSAAICLLFVVIFATLSISGTYIQEQFFNVSRTADISDKENTIIDIKERYKLILLSFGTYLILSPLLWMLANNKLYKNRQVYYILFLLLPFLIYLYNPNITRDFPWLLRRYITAVIPTTLILGVWSFSCILQSHKYVKNLVIGIYVLVQVLFIGILIQDRVDHRQYYRDLSNFFESQNLPKDTVIYIRGEFDLPNEATRTIPYFRHRNNDIIFRSSYLDLVIKESGSYLIDSILYEDNNSLIFVDSFKSSTKRFNGQKESRFYTSASSERELSLYLYRVK